jgi:hypothetical protein
MKFIKLMITTIIFIAVHDLASQAAPKGAPKFNPLRRDKISQNLDPLAVFSPLPVSKKPVELLDTLKEAASEKNNFKSERNPQEIAELSNRNHMSQEKTEGVFFLKNKNGNGEVLSFDRVYEKPEISVQLDQAQNFYARMGTSFQAVVNALSKISSAAMQKIINYLHSKGLMRASDVNISQKESAEKVAESVAQLSLQDGKSIVEFVVENPMLRSQEKIDARSEYYIPQETKPVVQEAEVADVYTVNPMKLKSKKINKTVDLFAQLPFSKAEIDIPVQIKSKRVKSIKNQNMNESMLESVSVMQPEFKVKKKPIKKTISAISEDMFV